QHFNMMVYNINDLVDRVYNANMLRQKAELESLRMQINPHFLYNTLDIIVWMIENEQKQEAVKVVTALARFFRISLSRGKSII
ncbi:sensor histidine kinase, partial [Klebsiella oxytoca]